ncbi:MAG: retron system putative HNH endonuclease [Byssovorax sp.]
MRRIKKGKEPHLWKVHRTSRGAVYDSQEGVGPTAEAKKKLREALLDEQGHLCCYCMARIPVKPDGMKIEHWAPQSKSTSPAETMAYSNLLGACPGGEGSRPADQHCDTAKGSLPLHTHPADPNKDCTVLFTYASTGKIEGCTEEAKEDIATLNLNVPRLVEARKAVLQGLLDWLKSPRNRGRSLSKNELLGKAQSYEEGRKKLDAFCQVAIYWLAKHASQRA